MDRRLTTIVAADMVGYSRLIATDEEGTIRRLRRLREDIVDPALLAHGGRIIKTMGDGLLVEFPSPVQAVQASISVQTDMARAEADRTEADRIVFRVGINLGDVVIDGDDVLGDGVNIAARLETLADPGGICISNSVHEQVRGKVGAGFVDLGPQQVKNIPDPVQVYALDIGGTTPVSVRKPKRRGLALLAVGLAVLALGLGGYLMFARSNDAFAALPEVTAEPVAGSLIVLPFEDYSEDRSLDHFADGLTEDLITDLSRWKELRVIARNTSMTYKDRRVDVRDVARETGTRYVLEGSVRRYGDQMRITAQLIDGQTGGHIWAERFEQSGSDVLALQDAVIAKIMQSLIGNHGVIREDEYARTWAKAETNLEEYDFYLRGHTLFYRFTPQDNQQAIAVWKEGLEKFPDSGLLKIKLGWGLVFEHHLGGVEKTTPLEEILNLTLEGMSDPNLPPAGHRFGLWQEANLQARLGRHKEVVATVQEAVTSYPFDAEGLILLGDDLLLVGEFKDAQTLISRALSLDAPLTNNLTSILGRLDYVQGDCAAATPRLDVFSINPVNVLFLAGCHAEAGRDVDALALLDKARDKFGVLTPADFPPVFRNMPGVTDRLTAQLARVGWPFEG